MNETGIKSKRGGRREGAGRPCLDGEASPQISIRMPERMLNELEQIARARIDQPDRAALIREMLADGIKRARKSGG